MEQYKQEFIEFMVDCGVLKFGDFVTKSGERPRFSSIPGSTAPVPSCAVWANIMRKRSMIISDGF